MQIIYQVTKMKLESKQIVLINRLFSSTSIKSSLASLISIFRKGTRLILIMAASQELTDLWGSQSVVDAIMCKLASSSHHFILFSEWISLIFHGVVTH